MAGYLALLLIAVSLSASPAFGKAEVRKIDYKGWKDCYELANPLVRLVIVPQIGGRIMEYSIGGENVMWQNQAELGVFEPGDAGRAWHNYGGHKAWNAPQAHWTGPVPDNYYDYLPAEAEPIEPAPGSSMTGVRITMAPVERAGLQFIREVYLSDTTSRVRLVETMRNTSDREIEWSIWGVTQVNVPCWIAFPLSDSPGSPMGWRRVLSAEYPEANQTTRAGTVGVFEYKGRLDKIGSDSRAGWIAYLRGQLAYVKQWGVRTVGVTYPDGGCNMEVFTTDDQGDAYAEIEVMSPIVKLKPGESTQMVEDWFLTRVNQSAKDIPDVIERLKLLQKRGLLPRGARIADGG